MLSLRTGGPYWTVALLLLLAPGPALAVIPAGTFEIELGGSRSIWLDTAAGENEFCDGFVAGFGGSLLQCEFSMFVDSKGKITGSVEVAAQNGALVVEIVGPIKGKLKGGKSGLTELSFSTKLSGEAGNGSTMTSLSGSAAFDGAINGAGILSGEWSTKFCSKAAGCAEDVDTAAPEALAGGGWTLVLQIADLGGGKLGGSAAAELGDGTTCPYSLSGKYSSKSDLASLKLSPSNATCSGTSISLKDVSVAALLEAQMKYKLFGQQGDTPVESVDQ